MRSPWKKSPPLKLTISIFFDQEQQNDRQQLTHQILEEIGDPCKSILLMYYFRNFSMESIASRMGYKNEGIAKKKKFPVFAKTQGTIGDYQN